MDEDWQVFFYDEEYLSVVSVARFHQELCDIGALVEAHPEMIYFYAQLMPYKERDFNDYSFRVENAPRCDRQQGCLSPAHLRGCPEKEE